MRIVRRTLHGLPLSAGRILTPIKVVFSWCDAEPYAVYAEFHSRKITCWPFDRDILIAGLDAPAGIGDYTLIPDLDYPYARVELILSSDSGHATVVLPTPGLRSFLAATSAVEPAERA